MLLGFFCTGLAAAFCAGIPAGQMIVSSGDLTDCLIGNLFMDFDPLFAAVSDFARVPPALSHGLPLTAV